MVALHLRPGTPFWTKEFCLAALIAILFHASLLFLFSIEQLHWESPYLLPSRVVSAEQPGRAIDLNVDESPILPLAPPPHLKPTTPLLFAAFPLSLEGPPLAAKPFKSVAFIRGPHAQKLHLPSLPHPTAPQTMRLSLRLDPEGQVFWYDWLEMSQDEILNRAIESWLRTLKLLPENRFQATLLEIQVTPYD